MPVAPETRILTNNGLTTISTLLGQTIPVNNGSSFVNMTVVSSSTANLLQVTFSNGSIINCTENHQFNIRWTIYYENFNFEQPLYTYNFVDTLYLAEIPVLQLSCSTDNNVIYVVSVTNLNRTDTVYSLVPSDSSTMAVFEEVLIGL